MTRPVVAAVRAELDAAPAAAERPGLTAAALALTAILDDPQYVAVQPAATSIDGSGAPRSRAAF